MMMMLPVTPMLPIIMMMSMMSYETIFTRAIQKGKLHEIGRTPRVFSPFIHVNNCNSITQINEISLSFSAPIPAPRSNRQRKSSSGWEDDDDDEDSFTVSSLEGELIATSDRIDLHVAEFIVIAATIFILQHTCSHFSLQVKATVVAR